MRRGTYLNILAELYRVQGRIEEALRLYAAVADRWPRVRPLAEERAAAARQLQKRSAK